MNLNTQEEFHRLYYNSHVWQRGTTWLGVPVLKNPFDLWIFQEIVHRTRPSLIIECGTLNGGSALYMACLCELIGAGRVLSLDTNPRPALPQHPRITYLRGSSVDPDTFARVQAASDQEQRVMVVLDSDHHKGHVLQELNLYSKLVTPGQYLIVEDGNINGHPVLADFGPGPAEALDEFLRAHSGLFEVDRNCEKFFMSFNPGGYLRRK